MECYSNDFMRASLLLFLSHFGKIGVEYYNNIDKTKCAMGYNAYSYQAIAKVAYGDWYKRMVNAIFFLNGWGSSACILILVMSF